MARLKVLTLRPILAGMPKKPELPPPQAITWTIYKLAAKPTWVGTVEAPDEATAIEKAAAEFRVPAAVIDCGYCLDRAFQAWPCRLFHPREN